ncbi:MAG: DUF1572 family protein [Gemmatimonadota bacterium]|nr:MAG: DUF1572 family protein [Gemmatimonadota bacterium]
MRLEYLQRVMARDLAAVREQIRKYEHESDLWVLPEGIPNSAGTLALHLAGNIQHFIGAQLGNTGYMRQRDAEFSLRDVPRNELESGIQAAIDVVNTTLGQLDPNDLDREFPLELAGNSMPTGLFLIHLATHLAYHLGQIDYHRRVVTGQPAAAGAQSLAALADGR